MHKGKGLKTRNIYLLNDMKIEGVNTIPLLKIEYIPQDIAFENYDALIFTSKNAVYSLDSFTHAWRDVPSFVIASKTAKVVESLKGKIEFIGNSGHGDDFAKELIPLLKNKKALYVRALKIVSGLGNKLKKAGIDIHEVITYKTACHETNTITLDENAVIIFSSPSTIECFFKHYTWKKSYKAIVIGQTTARYLPKEIPCLISKSTSIEDCIALAKEEALK
jgi:uroporphyrinogen-III synthase